MTSNGDIFILNCGSIARVIKYNNCSNIEIETDTGFNTIVSFHHLKEGNIFDALKRNVCDIGYLGDGIYNSSNNKKAYQRWIGIIKRCYNEKQLQIQPTYINAIICNKWHNFQNFAKWFNDNYIKDWEIDKDIKGKGLKIYSPETTMFVPKEINRFFQIKNKKYYGAQFHKHKNKCFKVNKKYFYNIKDAINYYWNEKYKNMQILIKKYPKFKESLEDYFEYYFNKHYRFIDNE